MSSASTLVRGIVPSIVTLFSSASLAVHHNELHVVQAFAEMVEQSTTGDVATYAEKITGTSERILETIDKECEITKYLSALPGTESVDLVSVVEAACSDATNRHPEVEMTTELPSRCSATATSAIDRALDELIENAIVHSDSETPTVTVRIEGGDETVRIIVADNGPGIPEMERNVLTKEVQIEPLYHGSGLGLWLVNLIVRQADGVL